MERDDLEKRIELAEARWQKTVSGAPASDSEWGFFSYGDGPPALGGGMGLFTWFPDRASMLQFIEATMPYFPPSPFGFDPDEIAEHTASIVEKVRTGVLSEVDGCEQLNAVLKTCSQFEWMGTVKDLLTGNHVYAARVRKKFRSYDDEGADSSPIKEDEMDQFLEFLNSWGY